MPTTGQWLGIVLGIQAPGAGGTQGVGPMEGAACFAPSPFPT